jgi:cyclase
LSSIAAASIPHCQGAPAPAIEIVPGVWFYAGDFPRLGQANSIIVEMKDYLVVVDANSVTGARAVAAETRRLSPKSVKFVLLTHHHGDHIYGNAVWTQAGATTLAHRSMLGELARIEPGRWRADASRSKETSALGDAPEAPRQTFSGELWSLEDSSRRIEVHYLGPAHTRDDVVVYLPRERILCSGDIAIHSSLNSFFDSDFANWPTVLRTLAEFPIDHVLPGHGSPGDRQVLELQQQFLETLRANAASGLAHGRKPAEIAAALQFPETLRPWVGPYLPGQVEQICTLLQPARTAGKP